MRQHLRLVLTVLFVVLQAQSGFAQIVRPAYSSSTTLSSSLYPSTYGSSVTLTATVTSGATGNVTFYDNYGAINLGNATLSNSRATKTISNFTAGTHYLTATYNGDRNFNSSTSPPFTQIVNKANLTITASSGSMNYGGAPPTITPSYSGFVNGETSSSLTTQPTCSTTANSSSNVGNYPSSCSGAVDNNYNISYVNGSVTVSAVSLTITASSGSMYYGGAPPTIAPSYSGFVNGQTASNLTTRPTCSTTAGSSSSVGNYPSSCSGAVDSNYSISYANGNVAVNAVGLTITASSASMTYGGAPPTITPTYAGFVNGQTASNLTTQPACSTTATSSSNVGNYPSSCSGAVDSNYSFSYANGTVAVLAAASVSTSSSLNPSTYGSAVTFTATVTGFSPTGSVTFFDFNGAVTLLPMNVPLNSGVATLTVQTLTPGSHSITASYSGDANNLPGTSAVLTQTVNRHMMTLPGYAQY